MTAKSPALLLAVGALVVGSLAGCAAEPTPTPTATPSATTSPEALSPGITDVTDTPGSGENLVGALADTTTTSCERAGDAWTVAGTATNPTDDAASYRIYVSLLNSASDTRALVQVDANDVEPGATADWTVDIPVAEDDLTCVLRVERYTA